MSDIPHGRCQCGCGALTKIAPCSVAKFGWVKGEPRRYLRGHHPNKHPSGVTPNATVSLSEDTVGLILTDKRGSTTGIAIIDIADYPIVSRYRWALLRTTEKNYYVATSLMVPGGGRKYVKLHRLLMSVSDPDTKVDHVDGDGLNCRRRNLRLATTQQNSCNRRKHKMQTSEYKGVRLARDKWEASVKVKGGQIYIGRFGTEREAAMAYNEAAARLHGEFARLNVI
jgi:HNH endonuclease/AP2 domain